MQPSMEMRAATLRVRAKREQPFADAVAHWSVFAAEYPEVRGENIFFMSLRSAYGPSEELTASYGREYHRKYSAYAFESPPPTARVPFDEYSDEVAAAASWPQRVPGWWNPDMQPRRYVERAHASRTLRPKLLCVWSAPCWPTADNLTRLCRMLSGGRHSVGTTSASRSCTGSGQPAACLWAARGQPQN
jgi:hypothetical protein